MGTVYIFLYGTSVSLDDLGGKMMVLHGSDARIMDAEFLVSTEGLPWRCQAAQEFKIS